MLEILTCAGDRTHGRPGVVKLITAFLQLTAGVGVLVLFFVALAVITPWNACASAMRSMRGRMTHGSRSALHRARSWRRSLDQFYLGTVAMWSSFRTSSSFSPERPCLEAEAHVPLSPIPAASFSSPGGSSEDGHSGNPHRPERTSSADGSGETVDWIEEAMEPWKAQPALVKENDS